jgi:hypothetical protein
MTPTPQKDRRSHDIYGIRQLDAIKVNSRELGHVLLHSASSSGPSLGSFSTSSGSVLR